MSGAEAEEIRTLIIEVGRHSVSEFERRATKALLSVLDVHKPIPTGIGIEGDFSCSICVTEGDIAAKYPDDWFAQRWPCSTVQAITAAWEAK